MFKLKARGKGKGDFEASYDCKMHPIPEHSSPAVLRYLVRFYLNKKNENLEFMAHLLGEGKWDSNKEADLNPDYERELEQQEAEAQYRAEQEEEKYVSIEEALAKDAVLVWE
jgi:hypothetical protein